MSLRNPPPIDDSDPVRGTHHLARRQERGVLLSDKVADLLLGTILRRSLLPGDRLPTEKELADQFGVSRTVVREAVRVLVAKGVIEVRRGSGLRVSAVEGAAVAELLALYLRGNRVPYPKVHQIRMALEIQMAGTAAELRTSDDLVMIRRCEDRFEQTIDHPEESAIHDLEFHRAIASATQNDVYLILLDAIAPVLLDIRRTTLSAGSGQDTIRAHRAILAAIESRDSAAAQQAMSDHLVTVQKWQEDTAARQGADAPRYAVSRPHRFSPASERVVGSSPDL